MATIGVDCQIVLDGTGYYVEPHSYQVKRPRLRKAVITKGGGERYVDQGPGKRVWSMTILAVNELLRYDGQPLGMTGEQIRDALVSSYGKLGTVSFVDPHKLLWAVHLDDYAETVRDLRTQLVSPSYLCHVALVEA